MEELRNKLIDSVSVKLSKLEFNTGQIHGLPANPRFIKDDKFHKLVKSIEENPEMISLREILIYPHNDKYVVIGGNMRLRAMKTLGYKEAPCKIIPIETTVEQLRAYTLKDNSGYGEWDFSMLGAEWDLSLIADCCIDMPSLEIVAPIEEREAVEDDFNEDADEVPTKVKFGEVWALGEHRLMCGDSTEEECLKKIMSGTDADLWLTDPPYNIAYEGCTKDKLKIANDNMSSEAFYNFLLDAFSNAYKVMKCGCPFYIWFASREHINFERALNDSNLFVRQEIIWNKNALVLGRQDYQWKHEPCLYGWKEGAHYFIDNRSLVTVQEDGTSIDVDKMSKMELKRTLKAILESNVQTTVIDENKPTRNGEHPTMKPVKLIGRLIRNSSKVGDVVLDNFSGSGTTLIACEQLGRKCRAIEYDPHYCDVIIARWEKLTGRTAEKLI